MNADTVAALIAFFIVGIVVGAFTVYVGVKITGRRPDL